MKLPSLFFVYDAVRPPPSGETVGILLYPFFGVLVFGAYITKF